MSVAIAALGDIVSVLGLSDHLAECAEAHRPFARCSWCRWALTTTEIETLVAARSDARALSGHDALDSVAGLVAVSELERRVRDVGVDEVVVPSARSLAAGLHAEVVAELRTLSRAIDRAVEPGGPVERRCLRAAGPVAAAVVQNPRHRAVMDRLPPSVRERLGRLSDSLSSQVQLAGLLPVVEELHPVTVPPLATQPEWQRRPSPHDGAARRARQMARTNLAPGSLEEFVVESVIEQVTTELVEMGEVLTDAAPPVRFLRPIGRTASTSRTRSMLWRVARVDWNLTFVDSGRADCWGARTEGDGVVTDVPWQVALAIDAAETCGLVSATHHERDSRHP